MPNQYPSNNSQDQWSIKAFNLKYENMMKSSPNLLNLDGNGRNNSGGKSQQHGVSNKVMNKNIMYFDSKQKKE